MNEKTNPVPLTALAVDCTSMADFLVDLPPRGMVGLRTEQPGYDLVVTEIESNQATFGQRAGVLDGDVESLLLAGERIARIDEILPAARKLVERLTESRAHIDDQRQRLVSAIASSVDNRAAIEKSDELIARYENTRAYRSAVGFKAARTRRQQAAAAEPSTNRPATPKTATETATAPKTATETRAPIESP